MFDDEDRATLRKIEREKGPKPDVALVMRKQITKIIEEHVPAQRRDSFE